MVEKITKLGDTMPKFDSAGNMILKKPEVINKVKKLEAEFNEIVNGKEFPCQYCGKEWKSEISKLRHEPWCPKNPNQRKYRRTGTKVKKKPKRPKADPKPEGKPKKVEPIIKELREFDKTFGITDQQIVKYIRDKMKG